MFGELCKSGCDLKQKIYFANGFVNKFFAPNRFCLFLLPLGLALTYSNDLWEWLWKILRVFKFALIRVIRGKKGGWEK